ncbi:hypothetical protein L3X40_20450 [Rhizorhapis sp. SPR117]|nr:hypothetical protein [Rhizorhapis sp. SPR117]
MKKGADPILEKAQDAGRGFYVLNGQIAQKRLAQFRDRQFHLSGKAASFRQNMDEIDAAIVSGRTPFQQPGGLGLIKYADHSARIDPHHLGKNILLNAPVAGARYQNDSARDRAWQIEIHENRTRRLAPGPSDRLQRIGQLEKRCGADVAAFSGSGHKPHSSRWMLFIQQANVALATCAVKLCYAIKPAGRIKFHFSDGRAIISTEDNPSRISVAYELSKATIGAMDRPHALAEEVHLDDIGVSATSMSMTTGRYRRVPASLSFRTHSGSAITRSREPSGWQALAMQR